jgi:hypothetical protein
MLCRRRHTSLTVALSVNNIDFSEMNGDEKKHPLDRRVESFNNLREFRRKDSAASTTSSLEALDFLADMCVEIDEIGTGITSPTSTLVFPKELQPQLSPPQPRKFFSSNSRENSSTSSSNMSSAGQSIKNLKRECSDISPRSRSSLTPASSLSRTLSKGYSFSSVGSNTFGLDHSDGLAMAILNGRSDSVEDRVVIPLTLYHYGEHGVYLLPTNAADIDTLVKGAQEMNHNSVFTFSLTEADPSQHLRQVNLFSNLVNARLPSASPSHDIKPSPLKSSVATPTPANSSTSTSAIQMPSTDPTHQPPPAKLINPKHIYKTSCDTYRVQMSKGSKTNPNGKFSRNTRNEVDALWLCEYALLLVERPNSFEDILMNGNYKCLLQRNLVSDPTDFATKLFQHMSDLSSRGLLKPAETDKLTLLLPKFLPQYHSATTSAATTSAPVLPAGAGARDPPLPSETVQESPLSFSMYSPTDFNTNLSNSLSSNPSFFPDTFPLQLQHQPQQASSYLQTSGNPPPSARPSHTVILDADQKKRRRGGQTPVMTQRYHSYPEETFDSTNPRRSSSSSPVFLQAPPGSMSAMQNHNTLSLTSQNLSQVNKLKPYPELSRLTSQYVKQKSRSFEETINTAPIDNRNNSNSGGNGNPSLSPPRDLPSQLRKFV